MELYKYLENKAKEEGINKIVDRAVITNQDDKILLMKRKQDDFMGGIYEIPGGNSEQEENIYDTLEREIKEETNFDLKKS